MNGTVTRFSLILLQEKPFPDIENDIHLKGENKYVLSKMRNQ